ncbi:MAG: hypothetical protein JST01_22355 [Cyanobacteria bacterium SZAS TMP-1]|nr:hypothetical protein [Cyanobacteria bacterium SZAS TMP-1]
MSNKKRVQSAICLLFLSSQMVGQCMLPAMAEVSSSNDKAIKIAAAAGETSANTVAIPKQILRTGVSLTSPGISPNSTQLANNIGLTPLMERIQTLRGQISSGQQDASLRLELLETIQKADILLQRTDLDIDFTVAAIGAELQVYNEILSTYTSDRDKLVARVNAASFISNGVLWAACEAFSIPTYKYPGLSVHSGTLGIAAGIVPSLASMYTLKAVNGKKKTSEADPNMLAKIFNYPTTAETEYPNSVWQYLHEVPADDPRAKKRIDQLIDRWVADSNMPAFTDRSSRQQLNILTASVPERKGLSIATLTARQVMLQQTSAEVMKMKRLLLDLTMFLQGEKTI